MKLVVVSICINEEKTIGQVLDAIPVKIPGITSIEKWVISDGSTDSTPGVAKKHGAHVRHDGVQKRLAFRFREAIDLALARGADILVNIDGDMQFNPADIPQFVEPIVNDEADFVAADRFTDPGTGLVRRPENMPAGKYYGNKLGAWVTGKLSGHNFPDVTCGFRAYSRKALMNLNTNGVYTYTQETFQVLALKRMRIKALPVHVTYFKDRKSRVVRSIPSYIASSAVNILRAYRDFAPLRFFGWLGTIPFVLGMMSFVLLGLHWLRAGELTPYKFLGFAGIYLTTLGLILWVVGLLADMQVRLLNNQEKIYEGLKELRFPQDDKDEAKK